jgi:hypothetical protein
MRLQLFEFNDLSWFPRRLRESVTDYLVTLYRLKQVDQSASKLLRRLVHGAQSSLVVDLCSGAGGMIPLLAERMAREGEEVDFVMTDRFPRTDTIARLDAERISYYPFAIEATKIPAGLKGPVTLFSAFHHFPPKEAEAILRSATDCGQGILILESTSRSFWGILAVLGLPLVVWATLLRAHPWRWDRFLLTYLIPIVPLIIAWDYLVSTLRAYSTEEMLSMAKRADTEARFRWEAGSVRQRGFPYPLPYLLGIPRSRP